MAGFRNQVIQFDRRKIRPTDGDGVERLHCAVNRVNCGAPNIVLGAVDVMQHTVSNVIHNHCGQPAIL